MKQYYIIEYLNCKKGFQKDSVKFQGPQAFEEAILWGKRNLDNFNVDMIRFVDLHHPLKVLKSKKSKASTSCLPLWITYFKVMQQLNI